MGRMIRPKAEVLPDSALVPEQGSASAPPRQFTHSLTQRQPFFAAEASETEAPAGQFELGAQVVLLHREGDWCRVVAADGRHVRTACSGLRRISD